jgi:hypothetical protein
MSIERDHLQPLPHEGFDLAAVSFPKVNESGCAPVLTNFYSVPLPVGTRVEAKAHAAYIEIWHEGKCVARHERCFGRQQKRLQLEHYLDALSKKPGALAGSTPLEQCRFGTVPGAGSVAGEFRSFLDQTRAPPRKAGWHPRDGGRPTTGTRARV